MIKSKRRWFIPLLQLTGSLLCLHWAYHALSSHLVHDEWAYGEILFPGFIGFMGLLNLAILLAGYEIEITETELVKKSFLGFYRK